MWERAVKTPVAAPNELVDLREERMMEVELTLDPSALNKVAVILDDPSKESISEAKEGSEELLLPMRLPLIPMRTMAKSTWRVRAKPA